MTPESEARPFFVIVAFIGTFALSRAGFEAHSSSGSWGGLESEKLGTLM